MSRVEAGPADAGPHLAAAGLQDQDAPGGHALCRHPFCGPLDAAGEGQPHPPCGGGCLFQHRLTAPPQTPLRRDRAPEDVLPAGGKDVVQRRFEARRAAALAVQIADEMLRQRGGGVPPGHSIAPHAQPSHILRHLQQEGPGGVPLPVEHRLSVSVRVGVEPRITALPREAEGQPLLRKPRQRQAVAVVEVPPRRRQAQDGLALRRRPRCVSGVRAEPVQPADHRRKPQQKRPIQRKHPPARHKQPPSLPRSMGRKRGCYAKEAGPPKRPCLKRHRDGMGLRLSTCRPCRPYRRRQQEQPGVRAGRPRGSRWSAPSQRRKLRSPERSG